MKNKYITLFKEFLIDELKPATIELEKITNEQSRKHLQKLTYTNLVDRFDFCVDKTLLELVESEELLNEILEKHKQPVSEGDLLRYMLAAETPREFAVSKLKDTLRNSILRSRHSEKVAKLLTLLQIKDHDFKKPRVNPSTGNILGEFTPQNNQIPTSIEGYCDWLYSRRNAIVHGGGQSKLLDNDIRQMKKKFKVEPPKTVRISLPSIKTAYTFYLDLISKCLIVTK